MNYITAQQAAEKWGVSDRRVRVLCALGKITGAVKLGKSYRLPEDAKKPFGVAGRPEKIKDDRIRYLKWDNEIVGVVAKDNAVSFTAPLYNKVVALYTKGRANWSPEQFNDFLAERMVSRERRDIERILFRMGLSQYDVPRIAGVTRGIHPKDLLWIARTKSELLDDAMTDVFSSVFLNRLDLVGDSIGLQYKKIWRL